MCYVPRMRISGDGCDCAAAAIGNASVNAMLAGGNTGQYTKQLTDEMKQQWGAFCFLRGAIEVLQNLEVFPVEVQFDDEPPLSLNVLNLFVANGRCAGAGLPVAPKATLNDGWLDAVVVLDGTAVQLADLALTYVVGDPREHDDLAFVASCYRLAPRCGSFSVQDRLGR